MAFPATGKTKGVPDDTKEPPTTEHMRVLVAEDDPVNSRIIKKRLEKIGHEVYLTINGEECYSAYSEQPGYFDLVLMDLQASNNCQVTMSTCANAKTRCPS